MTLWSMGSSGGRGPAPVLAARSVAFRAALIPACRAPRWQRARRGFCGATLALSLLCADSGANAAGESPAPAGKAWFAGHVLPRLVENGCHACHATGHVVPNVLVYEQLLPYLGMGWTRDDNVLIYKMANLRSISPERDTHVGGQRCASPEAEPCATFRVWWDREFGPMRER